VSGAGNINNVTVTLNISHSFDSDMIITLISPQGTAIQLFNRRGGSGDNLTGTTFSDSAGTPITSGVAPFSGSFTPEVALSGLNGQNANGAWTLSIQDAAGPNTGTLNSWSLSLGTSEPNVLTAADGSYSFSGLTAGSYVVRQEPITNYVFTSPATGGVTLNPASAAIVAQDFGNFLTSYTGSQYYLRMDAGNANVQVWIDTAGGVGTPTYTAAKSILSTLSFTGAGADDALTIDTSNGNPLTSGGVTFAGAGGTDTLTILGKTSSADTVVFNTGSVWIGGLVITQSSVETEQFDGKGGNDSLTVNGGPNVQILATQHLASLDIADGASASVLDRSQGGKKVLVTGSLNLHSTGTLDLFDNNMMVFYSGLSPLPSIVDSIRNARNGALWNGTGITSTSAKNRAAHNTTLGAMNSDEYTLGGSFDGEPLGGGPTANAVLVKYTYNGDADFNGKVDGSDYGRIDSHFNQQNTAGNIGGWNNGDFDGNGKIDGTDYGMIDAAFNSQSEVL
jgi:subtilisin-like proprotein convertase family protein